MRRIEDHHDGLGVQETINIEADDLNVDDGPSHNYRFDLASPHPISGAVVKGYGGELHFKCGPSKEVSSIPGVTDAAVLAVLIDRYRGFQQGPFSCRENAIVLTHLEEAMHWIHHRAKNRNKRGVLGKREK